MDVFLYGRRVGTRMNIMSTNLPTPSMEFRPSHTLKVDHPLTEHISTRIANLAISKGLIAGDTIVKHCSDFL